MNGRIQISLDPETRRRAKARAAKLKISLTEYLRRLIAQDLSVSKRKLDISAVFDPADSGPATNIARDKDKMIAKVAKAEHSARRKKVTRKQKESEIVRSDHSEAFALLGEAILNRKPVTLTYHGVRRELCPHIIGHTNGAERALVFQFGGSTRSKLPPDGEWRCLRLSLVKDIKLRDGPWRGGNYHRTTQRCVDQVYLDVNESVPNQPGRRALGM
jgi:hypothetical protein